MLSISSLFASPLEQTPPSISDDLAHIAQAAGQALSTLSTLFASLGGWSIPRTFLPLVETSLSYAASTGYLITVCIALAGYTNLSIIVCLLSTTTLIGVGVASLAASQQGLCENIDAFKEQNGELKQSVGHLTQEVSTLSCTNHELKQTKNDLNQTNQDLQDTNRALCGEISAFSQQNHRLAHQVSYLETIKHGFAKQLDRLRQETTTLESHNNTLKEEVTTLGNRIQTLNEETNKLSLHNSSLQSSLHTLEQRLSAFNELNTIFSQLAKDTQEVLNQEGSQIEELLKLFSQQIAHFKQQCDTLTKNQQVDASSHATFLSELQRLIDTSVLSKRLSELSTITQEIRQATLSLNAVQEKVSAAARTLGEYDGQIKERDATLSKTKEELGELFEALKGERKRLSEVREELQTLIEQTKNYKENANG